MKLFVEDLESLDINEMATVDALFTSSRKELSPKMPGKELVLYLFVVLACH